MLHSNQPLIYFRFREAILPSYSLPQVQSGKALAFTLGYLLPVVSANSAMTYGQIASRLQRDLKIKGRIYPLHIGGTAGALMDRLWELDEGIPPINALVINGSSKKPSKGVNGYLRTWFSLPKGARLSPEYRDDLIKRAAADVYAYPHWERAYRKAFKGQPPTADPGVLIEGTEVDGQGRFGGPAESKEHYALKKYILAHPRLVGAPGAPEIARDEKLLLSGDEIDVFFLMRDRAYLVEVKSIRSNEADFLRGIYQCIKYRAVFKAQREQRSPIVRIKSILVTEAKPPPEIIRLARQHAIALKVVAVNKLKRFRPPAHRG
jgi:hypothetical protein